MKLSIKINPKHLFRSKKSRSVSRSDPSSFSSGSSSDSSSHDYRRKGEAGRETPTTVLRSRSPAVEPSGDVYAELVQVFKMIDKDGDGKIKREELEAVLSRLWGAERPNEEELAVMLTELDQDGDGCISLEEFGAVSSAFGRPACESELRDTFDFFDADHDGRISAEELHAVLAAIGDEQCTLVECQRMISGADKNGDGFVCFEDFARMMEQQR